MHNRFGLQPSAFGVLAKISHFYGELSVSDFLKKLRIEPRSSHLDYSLYEIKKVIKVKDIADDISRFLPDLPIKRHQFDTVSYFGKVLSKKFKVCKGCLSEGKLHQQYWQLPYYTHCLEHKTPMVDGCEHIYADLSWDERLGCKRCVKSSQQVPLPDYLKVYSSIECEKQANAFVHNLSLVAERMTRPFDFIESPLTWHNLKASEVSELLSNAYKLSSRADTVDIWTKLIREHRFELNALGVLVVEHDLKGLASILNHSRQYISAEDPVDIEYTLKSFHSKIEKAKLKQRSHIDRNDTPLDVSFAISPFIVANLLDIKSESLSELVDKKVIPAKKAACRFDKTVFDARVVYKSVSRIFHSPTIRYKNAVSAYHVEPEVLNTLLMDTKDISFHLLSGMLKGYWFQSKHTHQRQRTLICPDSLKALFKYLLDTKAHIDHLTALETKGFLGVNIPSVNYLIENGYLSYAKWRRESEDYVDILSIKAFYRDYVCINREAILKGVNPIGLKHDVERCCGVKAHISRKILRQEEPLIVFSKTRLNPCCLEKALNNLEVFRQQKHRRPPNSHVFVNSRPNRVRH